MLGKLIDHPPGGFDDHNIDAVHVAVAVCRSGKPISAGDYVQFTDDHYTSVTICPRSDAHGVVDPFLPHDPRPGQMFSVLVNPRIVEKVAHRVTINEDVRHGFHENWCEGVGCQNR